MNAGKYKHEQNPGGAEPVHVHAGGPRFSQFEVKAAAHGGGMPTAQSAGNQHVGAGHREQASAISKGSEGVTL